MTNKTFLGFVILFCIQLSTTCVLSSKINRLESNINGLRGTNEIVKSMTNKFNKNIKPSISNNISKTITYFNLDTNERVISMCVAQILTESGGNHYDNNNNILNGGGAIGVCQILPSTAVGVISSTPKIKNKLINFGVTPIKFDDVSIPYHERLKLAKEWLFNEKNNIALWGGIMSNIFTYNSNIERTLIAYNAGVGGLRKYINSGGELHKHPYVNKISVLAKSLNGFS